MAQPRLVSSGVHRLEEGEIEPVALTLHVRRVVLSIPLGAYVAQDGKTTFVPAFDLVGLAAVVLVAAPAARLGITEGARLVARLAKG